MSVSVKRKTVSKSKSSSKSRTHLNKSRKCGSKTRKMRGGEPKQPRYHPKLPHYTPDIVVENSQKKVPRFKAPRKTSLRRFPSYKPKNSLTVIKEEIEQVRKSNNNQKPNGLRRKIVVETTEARTEREARQNAVQAEAIKQIRKARSNIYRKYESPWETTLRKEEEKEAEKEEAKAAKAKSNEKKEVTNPKINRKNLPLIFEYKKNILDIINKPNFILTNNYEKNSTNKEKLDSILIELHNLGHENMDGFLPKKFEYNPETGLKKKSIYSFLNQPVPPKPENEESYRTWKAYQEAKYFELTGSVLKTLPESYDEYVNPNK
jgi:hypothetical protein